MLTIKGRYENGAVQLLEQVEGLEGQEVIVTFLSEEDTEASAFATIRAASLPTLLEYWDNEKDTAYDSLRGRGRISEATLSLSRSPLESALGRDLSFI